MEKKIINLHLISDSTGETLSSVARAVLSQFEKVESNDFIWSLIRTKPQLDRVLEAITKKPGIVLYTIMHDDLVEEWNGEKSAALSDKYNLAILATPHDYLDLTKLGDVPILNTRGSI